MSLPSMRVEKYYRIHRSLDAKGTEELWALVLGTKGGKQFLLEWLDDSKSPVKTTEITISVKEQMPQRKLEKVELSGGSGGSGAVWYKQLPGQSVTVTGWFPAKVEAKMLELSAKSAKGFSAALSKELVEAVITALATPPAA